MSRLGEEQDKPDRDEMVDNSLQQTNTANEAICNLNHVIGLIETKLNLSCGDQVESKIQEAIQLLQNATGDDATTYSKQNLVSY